MAEPMNDAMTGQISPEAAELYERFQPDKAATTRAA